ncbi:hypothetical protein BLNAU_3803 [Blattamonas nauphoetae]|uniref:CCZ1/INTU/HSP4 first Longin domain-containing protein n=1 Tax=Blattamonas nauphoetae TaxID=2049346 RepID=A0ABQ9YC84_9EUKA|nr:hypothetical protein BLNAU_3803 [Blattamonas nauphoetae]
MINGELVTSYLVVNNHQSVVYCNHEELEQTGAILSIAQEMMSEFDDSVTGMVVSKYHFAFAKVEPYVFMSCTSNPLSIPFLTTQLNVLRIIIFAILGQKTNSNRLSYGEINTYKQRIGSILDSYTALILHNPAFVLQSVERPTLKQSDPGILSLIPEAFPHFTRAYLLSNTRIIQETKAKGQDDLPDEDLLLLLAHANTAILSFRPPEKASEFQTPKRDPSPVSVPIGESQIPTSPTPASSPPATSGPNSVRSEYSERVSTHPDMSQTENTLYQSPLITIEDRDSHHSPRINSSINRIDDDNQIGISLIGEKGFESSTYRSGTGMTDPSSETGEDIESQAVRQAKNKETSFGSPMDVYESELLAAHNDAIQDQPSFEAESQQVAVVKNKKDLTGFEQAQIITNELVVAPREPDPEPSEPPQPTQLLLPIQSNGNVPDPTQAQSFIESFQQVESDFFLFDETVEKRLMPIKRKVKLFLLNETIGLMVILRNKPTERSKEARKKGMIYEENMEALAQLLSSFASTLAQNYFDMIHTKISSHGIWTYRPHFKDLVHFVLVNRSTSTCISPIFYSTSSPTEASEFIHSEMWRCIHFGQNALSSGYNVAVAKSTPFIYCYTFYLVNSSKQKRAVKPPRAVGETFQYPSDPHWYRQFKRKTKDVKQQGEACELFCLYTNNVQAHEAVSCNKQLIGKLWTQQP